MDGPLQVLQEAEGHRLASRRERAASGNWGVIFCLQDAVQTCLGAVCSLQCTGLAHLSDAVPCFIALFPTTALDSKGYFLSQQLCLLHLSPYVQLVLPYGQAPCLLIHTLASGRRCSLGGRAGVS